MPPQHQKTESLLDVFLSVARNSITTEDPVLECGSEQWTYGDLDSISSGIALKLYDKYGLNPTVAVVSENHPYMLAILLATWKLGGIFAPLDPHSPLETVKKMLENVAATFAVIPDNEEGLKELLQSMDMPMMPFSKDTGITTLTQSYLDQTAEISPSLFPLPSSSSLAAYLHTSSASSISNLKCVQLTHESIARGSQSFVKWFRSTWPSAQPEKLKVLGFSPWTHIMAMSHDLGGATFGTGGCYVFGVPPSGYPLHATKKVRNVLGKAEKEMDVLDQLLETAVRTRPDVFLCVPWVLEGFKERYERLSEGRREQGVLEVKEALQTFKSFGVAGAAMPPEVSRWAKDMGINISNNIGMTELGGPLFYTSINHLGDDADNEGWPVEDCLIEDAKLVLLDDGGREDTREGELVITSRYISRGYLKYDNSSFSESSGGLITFKTGDIYFKKPNGRLVWKGRKEDFIQMISGETLDPRAVEKTLKACPVISHCCVVGNNFTKGPSDVICLLIQPTLSSDNEHTTLSHHQMAQMTKAVATVNRTLLPPLRIAWSRVGILEKGMTIPYTTKGNIFRKKLEALFGDFLEALLAKDGDRKHEKYVVNGHPLSAKSDNSPPDNSSTWNKQEVRNMIAEILAGILGLGIRELDANSDTSFAELGMDSNMAVRIVNQLNSTFSMNFPLNTCHTLINLTKISEAVLVELGLKEARSELPKKPQNPTSTMEEEIVIVGQALRLPGDISTPESFWKALIHKRDDIMTSIPADRWDHSSFYRRPSSTSLPQVCDISFEKAGFIDVAHFDNNFFGISAPEALFVSPSIRLTLETAFKALENACIPMAKIKGTSMGVFVAAGLDDGYNHLLYQSYGWDAYTRFFGTGISASTASGRLSYLLDVHGPSTTTDTACSSGLVVLDQAVKYLQSGDGDSAIVAAVNTNLCFLSAQNMTSPHSRCATFTDEADGYVPSEGSIAVVLKTKKAAMRDGDNILAVIKSTDVMHGGKSQGLVAPNVTTQIALQRSLLAKAGLEPSDIDFLETHGTGTSLGDLIEIQGINEVFRGSHTKHPLVLGAAKTCIGHTELAAGLVGLLRAIASLKYAAVPGLVHLTEHNMNPSIDCTAVPIQIPCRPVPLPTRENEAPFRGLVLSNGFAGTIAGVVLEASSLEPKAMPSGHSSSFVEPFPMPFVVSAKTVEGLKNYLRKYLDYCRTNPAPYFADLCYTTCVGREHYRYRFSCAVSNMQELILCLEERLRSFDSEKHGDITARRIAFAFPGQGSQYQGMATNLVNRYPEFKDILSFTSASASQVSGYPILSFLVEKVNSYQVSIDDSQVAQICIFVYQYSLFLWLETLGIEASAVLGSSLGEISAAVVAGAMSYEVGLELVVKRAKLLRSDPFQTGGMAIIASSEENILQLFRQLGLDSRLVIAVYNGPESHVISGEHSAIDVFLANAKIHGLRCTKLNVEQAFHSPLIHCGLPGLQRWTDEHKPSLLPLNVPLYSTLYGSEIPADTRLGPSYWVEHARDPVKFSRAAGALATNQAIDIILDLGPQPFIWTALQALPHRKTSISLCTKPSNDQNGAFLRAIALLFESAVTPNFERLFSRSPLRFSKIAIPSYPFQRQRHYPDSIPSRNRQPSAPLILNSSLPIPNRLVQFEVNQVLYDLLSDHRIEGRRVAPGASLVDFFAKQSTFKSIKSLTFHSPLVLESPHVEVTGQIDAEGRFSLDDGHSKANQVCSGTLATHTMLSTSTKIVDNGRPPERRMTKAEIYECFKSVQFGPSFRNVQEIRSWSTHADALITVHSTPFPTLDRIRKIDCCLHAFGAIIQEEVPQLRDRDGAFLPTSLDDFTLHSDDLPETFLCRYYLPLDVTRNYHVISLPFDVLSLSGDLLISCGKYAVAWIPAGVVIQRKERTQLPQIHDGYWLRQAWIQRDAPQENILSAFSKYDQLLLVATETLESSRLARLLPTLAEQIFSLQLPTNVTNDEAPSEIATPSIDIQFKEAFQYFASTGTLIVLDLTSVNAIPTNEAFNPCHRHVLRLMQLLSSHKVNILNFVVISQMSVAAHFDASPMDDENVSQPSVGAVVQGMIRVFRRETGYDNQIWALDLPSSDVMTDNTLQDIILRELNARQAGLTLDRTVAYRRMESASLERLVPALRNIEPFDSESVVYNGTSVIVGLGSIGAALAGALISKGSSMVVFIGRRPSNDVEVHETMCRLNTETNGRVSYVQADVCDLEYLRTSIVDIQARYGAVENLIHSAAVISDSTIQNVDSQAFERVLRPKVMGAWNLHIVSEELCPSLQSFVLLSSISVSLGNQGQVAYVAGNSYMEVLAAYRQGKHLPASAIQLGPWESRLTQKLDAPNSLVPIINNETGIPLILKAMFTPDPVQVVANMDVERFAMTPAYSQDPFFQDILPSVVESARPTRTEREVTMIVNNALRDVLELKPSEKLETADSLTACGIDSISFAQIRGKIMNELEIEVPMLFLSDSFTILEMIAYVVGKCRS
ncbi:hypothetical protein GALMADRAFT_232329 [Galerina marginata CBS 339.88]|uniref:Carrier domain-containing protein n=1 Tax=Galerina marginata (strain CBS 339.88) TaxID=685588 RepID=A0A067SJP5_GALM3|nr:hypothetical protein GALMADRAFT_232329 [Galerina marginata CBS 339.88]